MDKFINRLIENPWFIRVIALILALLLFENVNQENQSVINVPQDQDAEIIKNVPVTSYYDTENLVVSGVPETVTITLSGPKSNLQQAVTQRGFEVYVDLTEAEIGTQEVPIQIRDISERLTVKIEPETVEVSVQEKVTKEFSVEAEFNSDVLADGYISDAAEINPKKVKITGAKDVLEKISYVKATLDVKGPIQDTLKQEAEILVLDQELNKLDVVVEPRTVEVTIPIKASSKKVPIRIVENGTLPEGVVIDSITLEKEEATIIAEKDVLDKAESVRVEVDVSEITGDTEITLPVIISDGIVAVDPELVKVTIKANKSESKTLSNLPISIQGLSDQYKAAFRDPSNGSINVTITGTTEEISSIDASNFQVYVDASDLDAGDHDVKFLVDGPDNVTWKLAKDTGRISITQKEA